MDNLDAAINLATGDVSEKDDPLKRLDLAIDQSVGVVKKQAGTVTGIATKFNPDQIAQSRNLGRQVGVPDDIAERNPDAVRRKFISQKVEELYDTSPVAGRKLSDPSFAKLTHDITDELAGQEQAIKQLALTKKGFREASELSRAMSDQKFSETIGRAQNFTTPERSWGEAFADPLASFASGANTMAAGLIEASRYVPQDMLLQGIMDFIAPSVGQARSDVRNEGQAGLNQGAEYWQGAKSEEMQAKLSEFNQAGMMESVGMLLTNPSLMIDQLSQSLPYLAPGAGAARLGGVGTIAYITATEAMDAANSARSEAIEAGASVEGQDKAAAMAALITAPLVFLGNKLVGSDKLEQLFLTTGQTNVSALNAMLREAISGAIEEGSNQFGVNIGASVTFDENRDITQGVGKAAAIGGLIESAQGGAMAGISKAAQMAGKINVESVQAESTLQAFANIQQLAEQSKLKQRSSQDFATFLQEAGGENGIEDVYIDARTFMQEAENQGIDVNTLMQSSPLINQQLEEATRQGTDLVIPVGEFGASIAGTEFGNVLLPHLRADENAISAFEAQNQLDGAVQELQSQAEQVTQKYQADQEWNQSLQEVNNNLLGQLNAVGRFTPENNKAYVQGLVAPWYSTLASNLGITPSEAFARYPLQVSDAITTQGLEQSETVRTLSNLSQIVYDETYAPQEAFDALYEAANPEQKQILDTLSQQQMLGFEYPHQAISEIISNPEAYQTSPAFKGILTKVGNKHFNQTAQPQTETEAFKKWFGDSKVVDEDGKPLVVYHGTGKDDFSTFKPRVAGATWFADNTGYASKYFSYLDNAKNRIIPAYLSMKNPLIVDMEGQATLPKGSKSLKGVLSYANTIEDVVGVAKQQGYDGAIFKNRKPTVEGYSSTEYAVFNPNQIKSAIGNNGNFDPNDANILNQSGFEPNSELIDASVKLFGTTNRFLETGYILPDGRMLDMTGRHQTDKDNWPYIRDERAVDHRDLHSENMNGFSMSDMLESNEPSESMYEFMQKTGAMRVDFASGVASSARQPSDKQLSQLAKGINGEYLAVDFITPNGNIVIDAEFDSAKLADIRNFFSNAANVAGDTGVLAQKARGQISFGNDIMQGANITLLKNADASTFIHELGHFFLEVYADVASKPDAPQNIVNDMNELLNWFGVNSPDMEALDAWRSMSLEEKRPYHEKLARGFEQYALDGKAPTIALAKTFAKLRDFMLSAYKSMKQFFEQTGDAALTKEVRQVFDRMLASDEAINQAEQVRGMMPLFASMEEAGMSVEEYAEYLADDQEATEEAKRQLDARSLRDLKWLRNARKGAIRELQKEAREQRRIVRMDVRREVMSQPVYQAYSWLKQVPELPKAEKAERLKVTKGVDVERDSLFTAIAKLGGLNREMATAEWGIDREDKQSSNVFGKPVLRKIGGLSPDGMAEALAQYGYLPLDENGKPDLHDFEDKFFNENMGDLQYSTYAEGVMFRKWQESLYDEAQKERLDAFGMGKLNLDVMKGLYPDEAWRKLGVGRTGMIMSDGYTPDQVAELFGFTSGDHLVQALMNAEKPQDIIEAMTDARMTEKFADLTDEKKVNEAADKAVHNDIRARVLATELSAQNKALGNRRILEAAAKQYAERQIAALKVRDIKSAKYTRAESKAAKLAEKAMRQGDTQTAVQAKRDQLLNNRSAKAAMDAIDEVERSVKYLNKFSKESTRKNLDIDYIEQIEDILTRFDLRTGQTLKAIGKRKSLVEWVESQKEQGLSPVVDEGLLNEARRTSYKELPLEQFRALVDSVKNIEHLGRLKKTLLTAKDKREFSERMAEARASMDVNANRIVPERATPNDFMGKSSKWGRRMAAAHRKFSSFLRELDGGKDLGVMADMLLYPMYEAGSLETDLRAKATDDMQRLFATIEGNMDQGIGNLYAVKRVVPNTNISLTHEQRIMFAMNWGNEGNRQRLLDGGLEGTRSIAADDANAILDTITKEEWDFIQNVWDYIGTYKPLIAEQERRLTGREPVWIDATPVTTKFGVYPGGYFPAKYDAQMSTRSESLEAAADLRMAMKGAFNTSSARDGYTQARADAVKGRPILLSFDTISRHVHEVTHRLAWQEWLTDATRVIKALDGDIREKLGAEALQEMHQQIRDVANGDAPITGTTDVLLSRIRNGTSIVGMGYRVSTALLQPSGIFQTWARLGFNATANGIKSVVSNPAKTHAWVMENSPMMRNRAKTLNREINEIVNQVRAGKKLTTLQASYFFMISKMQMLIDMPTYVGAYEKALADLDYEQAGSEDERKAIESKAHSFAGQTVIDTQTGGEIKDLAGVQKGSQGQKLFTNFYSYFSALYNLNVENFRTKKLTNPTEFADFVATALLLNVMPVIYSVLLKNMLKGECDWDDTECLLKRYKTEQVSTIFGQIIAASEIGAGLDVATGGDNFGYSGTASLRLFAETRKLFVQAGQGEADMPLFKSLNNVGGILLHYPSGQINTTVEGMLAIERGEVDGVNMFGAVVSGPPK